MVVSFIRCLIHNTGLGRIHQLVIAIYRQNERNIPSPIDLDARDNNNISISTQKNKCRVRTIFYFGTADHAPGIKLNVYVFALFLKRKNY